MIQNLPISLDNLSVFNHLAIVVINFVAFSLLVSVVSHTKLHTSRSKQFAAMTFSMLLWVDFAYSARLIGDNDINMAETFLRIAWIATPPFFYYTYATSILILRQQNLHKLTRKFLLITTIALSLLTAFTDIIIEGVTFRPELGILDIQYGVGFIPFLGAILTFIFFTLQPLFSRKLTRREKVFLLGVITFYIMNAIFNISLPAFLGITHLYFLGDYSTIILLAFTTYAIVRHRLFDVKVVTTEMLTVLIWLILLINAFASQSRQELVINIVLLVTLVIFGIFLIRSILREIKQKDKLEVLTKQLEQLDKQKDEFVNVAAHELRAPMTAIKGYLSMILEGDAGEVPQEMRNYLDEVVMGNERLIRLVNNMLNVSRIEEGRMVYSIGDVELNGVVKTVVHDFLEQAEQKGLKLTLETSEQAQYMVTVDPDRIYEVVSNLISNAVKYTDSGSVVVKVHMLPSHAVRVEVADTGPGMSQDEQQKLFQKFYRAESNVGKQIGTGLGLYISKLLIEKFGGKIGLQSEKGKGSTFWFELPLKT